MGLNQIIAFLHISSLYFQNLSLFSQKVIEKSSQYCYMTGKTLRVFTMNLRSSIIVFTLLSLSVLCATNPGYCERTWYLSVCQELVSSARAYEARAEAHNKIARSFMLQIENMAQLPKNQGTIAAMDNLFAQYDQNRKMEHKFRELYRQATEEAKQCMKSID